MRNRIIIPWEGYDELSNFPAIYTLTHNNIPIYCGGTKVIKWRIYCHFYDLFRGNHGSIEVWNLYSSCNGEGFGFKIIERVSIEKLKEREAYWTEQFLPTLLNSSPLGKKYKQHLLDKKSELAKRQMSDPVQYESALNRCLENSKKVSERMKSDPEFYQLFLIKSTKGGDVIKEKLKNPAEMEKHKEQIRRRWADPDFREKMKEAQRKRKERNGSIFP